MLVYGLLFFQSYVREWSSESKCWEWESSWKDMSIPEYCFCWNQFAVLNVSDHKRAEKGGDYLIESAGSQRKKVMKVANLCISQSTVKCKKTDILVYKFINGL